LHATATGSGGSSVSDMLLDKIVAAAIADWEAVSPGVANRLSQVSVRAADLPGTYLGLAYSDRILIDHDAAGHGWFTDDAADDRVRRIDLLTAVVHELGHVLGLADIDDDSVMDEELSLGMRSSLTPLDAVYAELQTSSLADFGCLATLGA
jgi:hypothetical protein